MEDSPRLIEIPVIGLQCIYYIPMCETSCVCDCARARVCVGVK